MLPPPPAAFLGLGTGSEVEVGTRGSSAEGLSPRSQQGVEEMPVRDAAVWAGVCFLSFPCVLPPSLGSITLGSDTCFPLAPKLSCLHFLNGKRRAGW